MILSVAMLKLKPVIITRFYMNLTQFWVQLENATSLLEATRVLDNYLKQVGVRYYAFTYYSGHIKTGRKLIYDYASPLLRPWHEFYLGEFYADCDRTLEENSISVFPMFWDVKEQLKSAKKSREQRMRKESIKFGVDKGLSIPVHGPNYDFASMTLHQFRHEKCLENYQARQHEWLCLSIYFYQHVARLIQTNLDNKISYQLTKRERQCLMYVAKFWRVEHIAEVLKISPRTVNFHLQNANKKIGVNNKYQASYKYLQFSDFGVKSHLSKE